MGYTKIVQYGDVTEIYRYEKNISRKKGISVKKAMQLQGDWDDSVSSILPTVQSKRLKENRLAVLAKGQAKRSKASIRRSKTNFFRLVHHNNCCADTIHFVTLTFAFDVAYLNANEYVRQFFKRLRRHHKEISIHFISVPEKTKKGRFHFHLLVYDLPPETASIERETRYIQRYFQRGYVDVVLAGYRTKGLAGYMAKYMAKSLGDETYAAGRGYSHSQGIAKPSSAGGNSFDQYIDYIVDFDNVAKTETSSYDVPYLGNCQVTRITK